MGTILQILAMMAPMLAIGPLKKALASLTKTTAKDVGASLGTKLASTRAGGLVSRGLAGASAHVPEWAGKGKWNLPGAMGGATAGLGEIGLLGGAFGATDVAMNSLFGGHSDAGQPQIMRHFEMPNTMAMNQIQQDADLRKALEQMGIDLDNDQVQQIMRIL